MKKIYTLLFAIILTISAGFAQVEKNEEILPKYPTPAEIQYMEAKAAWTKAQKKTRGTVTEQMKNDFSCVGYCGGQAPGGCYCDDLCAQYGDCCTDYAAVCQPAAGPTPTDLVVPGEFEESQAVVLRWTYSTSASWRKMYAELIDAIQQEVPVWILINSGGDSTSVKSAIAAYGVTLTNHEFLIKQTNSIWARDYGPWGFYYTDEDELAFVDMQYYTSRPLDNQVPAFIANKLGVPYYTSPIAHEGGNLFVDGFGHAYHSTSLYQNNLSRNGWNQAFTAQVHEDLFRTTDVTPVTRLNCDGGTGHIDMYAKLLDEETLIASEYPAQVTASDKQIIEDNVDIFEMVSSNYGSPLKIHRIPMPLRDSGTYSTTCSQIDADARGFVNGLTINKTFIVPIYSNSSSPALNQAWDAAALDQIREIMPGYNVVGIDSRVITPSGGALHCITMQIPASNPIRYWHPKVEGLQAAKASYPILSKITNKDGIAQATCLWKVKGTGAWNSVALNDSAGYFVGAIPNLAFTVSDTIIYYLNATSNNGKSLSKPIVAPEGYYAFYFDDEYVVPGNCEIPAGLTTTNITGVSAKFNWATVQGASSYTVRGTVAGSSNYQTVEINNPNATAFTAPNLNPNTNYVWQIRANCLSQGATVSEWSALQPFTTGCAAPTGLSVTNIAATSASISWTPSTSATGYRLRGRVVGGPWQTYEFNANTTSFGTGNILSPGTNYEIQVRAYCNAAKTILTPWTPSVFFSTSGSGIIGQGVWGMDETVLNTEVYPNPNQGQFTAVVYNAAETFMMSVRDITGREIYSRQYAADMAGTPIDVALNNAAKGVYFLQITSGDAQHIEKLIVR